MFIDESYEDPPDSAFSSRVAQFIVFNRLPQLNACLPQFKETEMSDEEVESMWLYW